MQKQWWGTRPFLKKSYRMRTEFFFTIPLHPVKGRPTVAPHISPKEGETWGTLELLQITGY